MQGNRIPSVTSSTSRIFATSSRSQTRTTQDQISRETPLIVKDTEKLVNQRQSSEQGRTRALPTMSVMTRPVASRSRSKKPHSEVVRGSIITLEYVTQSLITLSY